MVVCEALRASVERVCADRRFSGMAEVPTSMSTVFDTKNRQRWVFNEACRGMSLKQHMGLFQPIQSSTECRRAVAKHSMDDYKLSHEGIRAAAMSSKSNTDLLVLIDGGDGGDAWTSNISVLKTMCEFGRVEIMQKYFENPMVESLTKSNELVFMRMLVEWSDRTKKQFEYWGSNVLLQMTSYPMVLRALEEFKKTFLKPAAIGGHTEIWKHCIHFLADHKLVQGLTLRQWGNFFVDKYMWLDVAASGKFKQFWSMMTSSGMSRVFFRNAMAPNTMHERMSFVRAIDLAAIVAATQTNGMCATPWKSLLSFVRSVGDYHAQSFLDIPIWAREHARGAHVEIGQNSLIGFPLITTEEIPMVQSMDVYDLFLKESYADGFFSAQLALNISRMAPRGNLNTFMTMKTHGEALFGYVVLDFWASKVGGCGDMNDNLVSVLERAAFAVMSCHETAFTGAILATVAMRGYAISRLREVVKRTQDVLLADGANKQAREETSMHVQRVVTVPMMARAALCGDTHTWEWCISPTTAHRRKLTQTIVFSRGQILRFMVNATARGSRAVITWCMNEMAKKEMTVTTHVVMNILHSPKVADLALSYLEDAVDCGRSVKVIGERAMDLSPEAITVCMQAGVYAKMGAESADGQLEIDMAFKVAQMQKNNTRRVFPDRIRRIMGTNERWISMRYQYYMSELADLENDWQDFYGKVSWEISDDGVIRDAVGLVAYRGRCS